MVLGVFVVLTGSWFKTLEVDDDVNVVVVVDWAAGSAAGLLPGMGKELIFCFLAGTCCTGVARLSCCCC